MSKNININNNHNKRFKHMSKYLYYFSVAIGGMVLCVEPAIAAFDIDKGVIAATSPLITALETHWGKGLLITGGVSALAGEGDARQRAMRAGIGCTAGGAVVLGLLAMFK